ncbi:MAG: hypothetical protein JXB04_11855 [Kiritimatiellae bacterium]|nr:hypothetical protein [Kiritimatiellia bacterium]
MSTGRKNIRRVLSILLFAGSAAAFLFAVMIARGGGRWEGMLGAGPLAVPIRMSNAASRLFFGLVSAVAAYLVWPGARWDRRRRLQFVGRLSLVTVSFAVAFLLAEHGVRQQLRKSQGFNALEQLQAAGGGKDIRPRSSHALALIVRLSTNRKLIYELRPNISKRFGGKTLRINSAGMRDDDEYELDKRPGVLRIVGIGDSGMFGWNVEQGEDYMSVLESNLNARGDGRAYDVLNFACPGYNTQQEIELLRDRGLAYDPDIVVVGWCDNDTYKPFFLYAQRDFSGWDTSYLYSFVFEREKFLDLVKPRVRKARDIERDLIDPEVLDYTGSEGVRRALTELRELGKENGFQVLLVGPMGKRIVRACEELDIACLNTLTEIKAEDYPKDYAVHFMHPRPGGHRVIAEHLERFLDQKGWLGAPD